MMQRIGLHMHPGGYMRMVTLALVVSFGLILGIVGFAPMTWLDYVASKRSGGVLRLANATGTLWNGAGMVTVGRNTPQPILGPLTIRARPSLRPLGIRISLSGEGIRWEQAPDILLLANGEWLIPEGQAILLPLDFSSFPGMVGLTRLKAQPNIVWPKIVWRAGVFRLDKEVTVTLSNVSSALSPIKPLADLNAAFHIGTAGLSRWSVRSSPTSLLDIVATGDWEDATGKGSVRCRRYCDYVTGVLGLVGKKLGDEYVFIFGPR